MINPIAKTAPDDQLEESSRTEISLLFESEYSKQPFQLADERLCSSMLTLLKWLDVVSVAMV